MKDKIKTSIISKEDVTSCESYGMLVLSISSIIIFIGFQAILELGTFHAIVFISVIVALTLWAEIIIIRNENYKNGILKINSIQIIRNYISGASIVFVVILALVFNQIGIIHYGYPTAVFLISLSIFHTGILLHKFYFKQAGIFGLIGSISMFGAFLYFGVDVFDGYERYISSVIIGGAYLYVAILIEGLKSLQD